MTIDRMHIEFKVGLDKIDSANSANILPEEVDIFLQDAYEQFIETRISGLNEHRTGFEETQKRIDDLKGLIKTYSTTSFTSNSDNLTNAVFVDLPTDYRHAIQETVKAQCLNGVVRSSKEVEVIPIKHGMYNRRIKNPFTAPNRERVLRLAYQGKHELLYNDITPQSYRLRYIKNPDKIDMAQLRTPVGLAGAASIELDEPTHREIVAIAVKMALEAIMSNRYQTKSVETKIIE